MSIEILRFDVIVIVLPILRPCVVGRVNVNRVDLTAMREGQCLQRMEILTVDDRVKGLVPAALDLSRADEAGIDVIAERVYPFLLIRDTPPAGTYVLNMFCMRGSRLWGSRLHRACVV